LAALDGEFPNVNEPGEQFWHLVLNGLARYIRCSGNRLVVAGSLGDRQDESAEQRRTIGSPEQIDHHLGARSREEDVPMAGTADCLPDNCGQIIGHLAYGALNHIESTGLLDPMTI
jgi:hypothetical protein